VGSNPPVKLSSQRGVDEARTARPWPVNSTLVCSHDFPLGYEAYRPLRYALRGSPMALNIAGIDKDPDLAPPSRETLLRAADACSSPAATKSQLLLKLDALRSVMPVRKARWLDFLPFKLLDAIREDAERLIVDVNAQDQFWTSAGDILIDVANKHPEIRKTVHDVIAAGGDIEIAAHNESARITIASIAPSGQRQILFDSRNHAMTQLTAA
jgi:hypothetical protein